MRNFTSEIDEVSAQLGVILVVIPFDGRLLDGAVHALDLPVGPRMIDFRAAMIDAVLLASQTEHVR